MILDLLSHWKDYRWSGHRIREGFEYLAKLSPTIGDGKYLIDGDNLFCMVQSYETTPAEGHEFEAHRAYADIQYMISGEETILWAPTSQLKVTKPYTQDIEFYALTPAPTDLVLTPGRFCLLFPQDAHAPCIAHGTPCRVRKAVVKVRLK